MRKQVVVIGLGRFGSSLAETLCKLGHDVLAMDTDEKRVQAMATKITHTVQADATDEAVLRELGIVDFDVAIVALGSAIESSVLSTILLKMLGVKYVIARAEDELHGVILGRIGADRVVYPEREMGREVAHELTLRDVSDYMSVAEKYGVAKMKVPPYCVGKTLEGLGFGPEGKWELAALLVQRGKEVIVAPALSETLRENDILVASGRDEKLEQFLTDARKQQEGNQKSD